MGDANQLQYVDCVLHNSSFDPTARLIYLYLVVTLNLWPSMYESAVMPECPLSLIANETRFSTKRTRQALRYLCNQGLLRREMLRLRSETGAWGDTMYRWGNGRSLQLDEMLPEPDYLLKDRKRKRQSMDDAA